MLERFEKCDWYRFIYVIFFYDSSIIVLVEIRCINVCIIMIIKKCKYFFEMYLNFILIIFLVWFDLIGSGIFEEGVKFVKCRCEGNWFL